MNKETIVKQVYRKLRGEDEIQVGDRVRCIRTPDQLTEFGFSLAYCKSENSRLKHYKINIGDTFLIKETELWDYLNGGKYLELTLDITDETCFNQFLFELV